MRATAGRRRARAPQREHRRRRPAGAGPGRRPGPGASRGACASPLGAAPGAIDRCLRGPVRRRRSGRRASSGRAPGEPAPRQAAVAAAGQPSPRPGRAAAPPRLRSMGMREMPIFGDFTAALRQPDGGLDGGALQPGALPDRLADGGPADLAARRLPAGGAGRLPVRPPHHRAAEALRRGRRDAWAAIRTPRR